MLHAYKEILDTLEKHKATVQVGRYIDEVKAAIKIIHIGDEFGITLPIKPSVTDWFKICDYRIIGLFGESQRRTISWSDDGSQPDDEWLYCIRFSSGAYVFHNEYPTETFKEFFNELKAFGPMYSDTANNALYFTPDNAKQVHDAFPEIFERYRGIALEEAKRKRVAELEATLEKVRNS